uniref:Nfd101 n=1 Tax=Arundo donax TaxID=35708 RepID=A0A0A8ZG06_ARUDO
MLRRLHKNYKYLAKNLLCQTKQISFLLFTNQNIFFKPGNVYISFLLI